MLSFWKMNIEFEVFAIARHFLYFLLLEWSSFK